MDIILNLQGWFYIITGLWPVVHIKSFEIVTGPKTEKWLVKTVGLMIACSGIIFLKFSNESVTLWLAILNAFILGCVDTYYSMKKTIKRIYLLDAIIEFGFICAYIFTKLKDQP